MGPSGIGKTTLDNLDKAAAELDVPLWDVIKDETSVKTLAGRVVPGWKQRLFSVLPVVTGCQHLSARRLQNVPTPLVCVLSRHSAHRNPTLMLR